MSISIIRLGLTALGVAVAIAAPSAGSAQQAASEIVKIRAFSPDKTQALGAAMYSQDQAAWRATDLMLAAKPDTTGVFGWIATPYADGQRVRFLKGSPQNAQAAYEVVFDSKTNPAFQAASDAKLTAEETAQLRALQTAMAAGYSSCGSRPPNHIEMRDPDTGEWLVWILSPWTNEDGVAMGGHTRFTLSADGSTVIRKEAMSRGCLGMKPPQGDQRGAVMFVTQLVADTPLETHVFNALQVKTPIVVGMADETVWLSAGVRSRTWASCPTCRNAGLSVPPRSGS
jgi:hypothetical protein